MLIKLTSNVAVDRELIAWVKGERIGPRTITIVRLKDGSTLRVEEHPTIVIDKIGIK